MNVTKQRHVIEHLHERPNFDQTDNECSWLLCAAFLSSGPESETHLVTKISHEYNSVPFEIKPAVTSFVWFVFAIFKSLSAFSLKKLAHFYVTRWDSG